jgi:multidrug efflux pump subunit AcrA (membrane-fusion protein)
MSDVEDAKAQLDAARTAVQQAEQAYKDAKKAADAQRRQREAEEHALKRAEIIANVVSPGLPEVLVERMWGYAWQGGHSTGYGDVEAVLSDLDEMFRGLTIEVTTREA